MRRLIDFEAIKAALPMPKVLDHYGIEPRRGLIVCPFHRDAHPSCKIYGDGFYCFSCGKGGDVINFIAAMEGCKNIRAAEIAATLAGIDTRDAYRASAAVRARMRERAERKREERALSDRYDLLCCFGRLLAWIMESEEPFSDLWEAAAKMLPPIKGDIDEIFERLCAYE